MKPYLITNTPQHFTWTSWWASSWHTGNPGRAWSVHNLENNETLLVHRNTLPEPVGESSWHTGNPGRAWSVHNLENNETLLDYKYTATFYLNQLVSVIMTYREPRQSMKCTQFREQWNLTWLQIHRNILPEPVGERHHDIQGTQAEHEVYTI